MLRLGEPLSRSGLPRVSHVPTYKKHKYTLVERRTTMCYVFPKPRPHPMRRAGNLPRLFGSTNVLSEQVWPARRVRGAVLDRRLSFTMRVVGNAQLVFWPLQGCYNQKPDMLDICTFARPLNMFPKWPQDSRSLSGQVKGPAHMENARRRSREFVIHV